MSLKNKEVCGQRTQTIEQTHESIDKRQIRTFRRTDKDPKRKGVFRRPWPKHKEEQTLKRLQ